MDDYEKTRNVLIKQITQAATWSDDNERIDSLVKDAATVIDAQKIYIRISTKLSGFTRYEEYPDETYPNIYAKVSDILMDLLAVAITRGYNKHVLSLTTDLVTTLKAKQIHTRLQTEGKVL